MTQEHIKEVIALEIGKIMVDPTAPIVKATAAAVMALVGPRKLVWTVEIYTATIGHRAECYIITQSKNGGVCFLSSGHPHNIGALKYPTIEAAQAAAQAHADAAHWANTALADMIGGAE